MYIILLLPFFYISDGFGRAVVVSKLLGMLKYCIMILL